MYWLIDLISIWINNLLNVLVGDVHRVDEIIPGLFHVVSQICNFDVEQLISVLKGKLLLFRGQGVLNFLKLLI